MSLSDPAIIVVLAVVALLLIWFYRAVFRPRQLFAAFPVLAEENGWETFHTPSASGISREGIRGTEQGRAFEFYRAVRKGHGRHMFIAPGGRTRSAPNSDTSWWELCVDVSHAAPHSTYRLDDQNNVTTQDDEVPIKPSLAEWWPSRGDLVTEFRLVGEQLRIRFDRAPSQERFLHTLDFLVGAAERV